MSLKNWQDNITSKCAIVLYWWTTASFLSVHLSNTNSRGGRTGKTTTTKSNKTVSHLPSTCFPLLFNPRGKTTLFFPCPVSLLLQNQTHAEQLASVSCQERTLCCKKTLVLQEFGVPFALNKDFKANSFLKWSSVPPALKIYSHDA